MKVILIEDDGKKSELEGDFGYIMRGKRQKGGGPDIEVTGSSMTHDEASFCIATILLTAAREDEVLVKKALAFYFSRLEQEKKAYGIEKN